METVIYPHLLITSIVFSTFNRSVLIVFIAVLYLAQGVNLITDVFDYLV